MLDKRLIHPAVFAEFDAAVEYGLQHWPDLVDDLLEEYDSKIRYILNDPKRPRPIDGEVRRVNLQGFPYHIIYEPWEDSIRVYAFAPHRGRPLYWKDRLKD